MRFMMLVKHAEISGMPPKPLMDAIDKLTEEAVKSGTMVLGCGLMSPSRSQAVCLSGGKLSVVNGPFTYASVVIVALAIIDLKPQKEVR